MSEPVVPAISTEVFIGRLQAALSGPLGQDAPNEQAFARCVVAALGLELVTGDGASFWLDRAGQETILHARRKTPNAPWIVEEGF